MAPPTMIAHVLHWPNVGGTEIATLRIVQNLPEFSHTAFVAQDPSPTGELFGKNGVAVQPYRATEWSRRHPLSFLRTSLGLSRAFRRAGVGLVHCSDVMAAFDAALAARLARVPVVCHVRNPHPVLPGRNRPFLRLVNHFVFVSADTRSHFGLRVPVQRGSVIYDGLAVEEVPHQQARQAIIREFGLSPNVQLVGMPARLSAQKDHVTLLRAARAVLAERPDTHFLIIGDHSGTSDAAQQFHELQRLVRELGIGSGVTFTGFRSDVPVLLAGLDIVLLVSHFEGLPLVLLEAMAQERPVIATAVGGVPELVQDGQTGLLHLHRDHEQLARLLASVLRDEDLARRLGRSARELVRSRFSRERFAREVAGLYHSLLGGAGAVSA